MIDEMMTLRGLIEKSPHADLLREIIGFAAERLMELEVKDLTGAPYGEKSTERLVQRNGKRDRVCETQAGTVELRILKFRRGCYVPGFLKLRLLSGSAFIICPARPELTNFNCLPGRRGRGNKKNSHDSHEDPGKISVALQDAPRLNLVINNCLL